MVENLCNGFKQISRLFSMCDSDSFDGNFVFQFTLLFLYLLRSASSKNTNLEKRKWLYSKLDCVHTTNALFCIPYLLVTTKHFISKLFDQRGLVLYMKERDLTNSRVQKKKKKDYFKIWNGINNFVISALQV